MRRIWCLLLVAVAIAVFSSVSAPSDGIVWMSEYSAGLERAKIERKPVMIDFYTSWCYYCKVLDARTYTDASVISTAQGFVCVKINAERERQLARDFKIGGYPIIVFLSRDGAEIDRAYGYVTAPVLKGYLDRILADTARLDILAEKYKTSPNDYETAYLYADELMSKTMFKEAEKILEKVAKNADQKRRVDATLDMAVCRMKEGKYKLATGDLARFLNRFKSSERANEAELFYGLSLMGSGQKEKGLKTLEKLQERTATRWIGQEALRQITLARRSTK